MYSHSSLFAVLLPALRFLSPLLHCPAHAPFCCSSARCPCGLARRPQRCLLLPQVVAASLLMTMTMTLVAAIGTSPLRPPSYHKPNNPSLERPKSSSLVEAFPISEVTKGQLVTADNASAAPLAGWRG